MIGRYFEEGKDKSVCLVWAFGVGRFDVVFSGDCGFDSRSLGGLGDVDVMEFWGLSGVCLKEVLDLKSVFGCGVCGRF